MLNKNIVQNPYVKGAEGRKEWNDRYMNMSKAIRNWQLAFCGLIVITIILSFTVVRVATQSKIKPYVVETNNGVPYAIKKVSDLSEKDQLLINYAINQFVSNAKTILGDATAEKSLLDKVYAYSAENTLNFLQEFYAKNNPFELASTQRVTVSIVNSMPLSKDTWQIIWDETKRSANGDKVLSVSRWMANIVYKFGDVNPKFINDNPFGIYITDVTWSQSR